MPQFDSRATQDKRGLNKASVAVAPTGCAGGCVTMRAVSLASVVLLALLTFRYGWGILHVTSERN